MAGVGPNNPAEASAEGSTETEGDDLSPASALEWDPPYHYEIVPLESREDWDLLAARYARQNTRGRLDDADDASLPQALKQPAPAARPEIALQGTDRPLYRCLDVAEANGAQTAVIETHYYDADYRSEFSSFYSKTFAKHEDTTHRLHFFRKQLTGDLWKLPKEPSYIGYMNIRPQVRGVVGRTLLPPPPEIANAVRCTVNDGVYFFGQHLIASGVPFIQQDARLGSCAHAAAWMCYADAHLGRREVPRRLMAEFCESVEPYLVAGRSVPTLGLTVEQLSGLLDGFGLSPLHYELTDALVPLDRPASWMPRVRAPDPDASDPEKAQNRVAIDAAVKRVCCRYLNSGLPLVATVLQWTTLDFSDRHALVVCGYQRPEDAPDVQLIVHDDRRGPYLPAHDVFLDTDEVTGEKFKWEHLLVPLPPKVWVSGESAERNGCIQLLAAARFAALARGLPRRTETARSA